ncbi:hypothetical protein FDJ70_07835 [Clostridium botulinum]|uniref:Conserved repeat domain protein n=1 Tax=Clostridium botulinum D str. 1873 TaxID=592027 RepID=A0A9P2G635_CLOBO|nr:MULTISPECIES: Ig-like domain-containing protein [Clostridium]MBO3441714.1 Ig-like domain-containing protein [Clostridium haemolyticum]AYF55153.1 hypothetical protein DFH04_10600 [Clostridium novyi]EES90662.1 conserved repeat domain protein [Clostridium botulinum D str. 1873]NFV47583.1 hypothetical protein [Clostridium botulinum]QPW56051.1 Ig-like domain-containing protein [Clostridium botulinum]
MSFNNVFSTITNGAITFIGNKLSDTLTSSVLNIPHGSKIIYAELLWGGMYKPLEEDSKDIINSPIKLALPNSENNFIEIYPQDKQVFAYEKESIYCNSCNITDYVSKYLGGIYRIESTAKITSSTNSNDISRWTLAVIYKNPKLPFRKLNLYVGGYVIDNASSISIPISEFETPSTGQTNANLLISTLNKTTPEDGTEVLIGSNKEDFVHLLDNTDNKNYTIINIDASKGLTNSQNSAILKLSSNKKVYIPNAVGIQIDMNAPILTISQYATRNNIDNSNSIKYTITIKNDGFLPANNVKLNIVPNKNIQYTKNSLTINSNSSLNNIDEKLDLSTINPGNSSIVTFSGDILNHRSTLNSNPNTANLTYDFTNNLGTFHKSNKILLKNSKAINTFPPLINNYQKITYKNTPTSGKVLGLSSTANIVNYTIDTFPSNGFASVNSDGTWIYTPKVEFAGEDNFSINVLDSSGNSSISTIYILVKSIFANQDPISCCPCNIVYPHQLCKYKVNTNPYYCY